MCRICHPKWWNMVKLYFYDDKGSLWAFFSSFSLLSVWSMCHLLFCYFVWWNNSDAAFLSILFSFFLLSSCSSVQFLGDNFPVYVFHSEKKEEERNKLLLFVYLQCSILCHSKNTLASVCRVSLCVLFFIFARAVSTCSLLLLLIIFFFFENWTEKDRKCEKMNDK